MVISERIAMGAYRMMHPNEREATQFQTCNMPRPVRPGVASLPPKRPGVPCRFW